MRKLKRLLRRLRWRLAAVSIIRFSLITLQPETAWSGFYLHGTGLDGSQYQRVRFRLHGGTSGERLHVRLVDGDDNIH